MPRTSASPSFEPRIVRHIDEIDPQEWDGLSAGAPFSSHCWHRFGEVLSPEDSHYYVLLYQGGKAVARATFWVVRYELLPRSVGRLKPVLEKMIAAAPLLACRAPYAGSTGLFLPESSLREAAIRQMIVEGRTIGKEIRASFLLFDYLRPEQASLPEWPAEMVQYKAGSAGTRLAIRWNTFEDYLASLSHAARKDYRRERNQAARREVKITVAPGVDRIEEAIPLIQNVEAKYGSTPNRLVRKVLENASLVPSTWIKATIGDKLVGCGLLLEDNGAQAATLVGLDYSVNYVYFQLVYAAIDVAIRRRARSFYGGSGVYALKTRLGFEPDLNNILRFTGQTRLLAWLGKVIAG